MSWPRVLADFGVDADALFAECGLASEDFADPENVVPIGIIGRLLARSVEVSGCDHIGVLIGRSAQLASLGAVGFLMQSAPNVGAALQDMERHLHVHDRAAILSLDFESRFAVLGYRVTALGVDALDQIYCIAGLAGSNIMRALCGRGWRPYEVRLPLARPGNARPLREALDAPLRFDAERLSLVFPANDLQRPLATADSLLHRMMSERVRELERFTRSGPVERVRRLLRTLVFLPKCTPALVAARLGVSLRTLNRRLAEEGTSVHRLREEVAAELACQLLLGTSKTAGEVAVILGYSDASAFTRAFRRWCGIAPAKWRSTRAIARRREA